MSIEIKSEVAGPVAPSVSDPIAKRDRSAIRVWQRRRYQAALLAILVLVVAAVIGNSFLTRQYSPEGAVRDYLSALQSGDQTAAWNQIQVAASPSGVTVTATDEKSFKAALSNAKPDLQSFSIASATQVNSTTASVDISYDTSSGTKQSTLLVERSGESRFGIYPSWRVVVVPALLQLDLPAGNSGFTIDGQHFAVVPGKSTIAVLPLQHKFVINGTPMLAEQTMTVDSFLSRGASLAYSPRLTDVGTAKAKTALQAAFTACATKSLPFQTPGSGCPQNAEASIEGQWRVVGDPSSDAQIAFAQDLSVSASGHYQMVFAYQTESGIRHELDGAAYTASMSLSASDLTVTGIQRASGGVQPAQRPAAATDDAAKAVVAKALATCASVHVAYQADCPQQMVDLLVADVTWTQTGDPTANATVNFDGSTGIFTVTGPLDMRATYTSAGFSKSGVGISTGYEAYLVWDGQSLQLITIGGTS